MISKNADENILKIFCDVQHNKSSFIVYLKRLDDYCDNVDFDYFCDQFVRVLVIIQSQSGFRPLNPYYHNVFILWTTFLDKLEEKKTTLKISLIKGFVKYLEHSNKTLRFRVCEGLHAILKSDPKIIIPMPDEVFEKLRSSMLNRLQDVNLDVKLKSIEVLTYLQDMEDTNDPVTDALLPYLTNVNMKVRVAVVDAIAPVPKTIPPLVKRIRDINERVKIATCEKFCTFPVQFLTIVQRRSLLRNGLKDLSSIVRKSVEDKVLPWWLKNYNNNYLHLMMALSLDGNDQDWTETKTLTGKTLNILFKNQSAVNMLGQLKLNNKLIDVEELSWNSVMYWRCLVQYFKEESEDEFLEQILPETIEFSAYLNRFYSEMKNKKMKIWEKRNFELTLEELIRIGTYCDIMDECSRKSLQSTLLLILADNVSQNIISCIFIFINKVMPRVDKRIFFICEFVSNIKSSSENDINAEEYLENHNQIKHLSNEINKLIHDQKNAINILDLQRADQLKTEIENLKKQVEERNEKMNTVEQSTTNTDPEVILKCVNIIIELLQSPDIKKLNKSLRTLCEELPKYLLYVSDPFIQSRIMICYAILSTFNKKMATSFVILFAPILISYHTKTSEVDENILLSVIKGITDLILLWGDQIFSVKKLETFEIVETMASCVSFKQCVEILISMMDDKRAIIRRTSGIAVTKLLDFNRVQSAQLVSKLILKWFNPITILIDANFHQYLGIFLTNFNREVHAFDQYVGAVIPTLTAPIMAPDNSPLAEVSIDKLMKFLIHVTRPETTKNNELHKQIALLLLQEMENDDNNNKLNTVFSKALLHLDFSEYDEDFIQTFIEKAEDLLSILSGPITVRRSIQKCIYQLTSNIHKDTFLEDDTDSNSIGAE